jgi:HSP20 family protein
MDIYEKSEFLVIEVELPGMKKEHIEIYVSRDLVTIEGTKADLKVHARDTGGRISYLQLERKLGRLKREVKLPVACDTREVKATYKDGLLVIEFKKIKDRRGQRRRIPVE